MVAPSAQLEGHKQKEMLVVALPFFVIELSDDLVLSSLREQSGIVKVVVEIRDGKIGVESLFEEGNVFAVQLCLINLRSIEAAGQLFGHV